MKEGASVQTQVIPKRFLRLPTSMMPCARIAPKRVMTWLGKWDCLQGNISIWDYNSLVLGNLDQDIFMLVSNDFLELVTELLHTLRLSRRCLHIKKSHCLRIQVNSGDLLLGFFGTVCHNFNHSVFDQNRSLPANFYQGNQGWDGTNQKGGEVHRFCCGGTWQSQKDLTSAAEADCGPPSVIQIFWKTKVQVINKHQTVRACKTIWQLKTIRDSWRFLDNCPHSTIQSVANLLTFHSVTGWIRCVASSKAVPAQAMPSAIAAA